MDLVQVAKAAVPEAQEYTQADIDLAVRVFGALGSRPDQIPTTLLAYLQDYFSSADPLTLTTNSLLDFSKFTSLVQEVDAAVSTNNSGFTALTGGPALTGVSDGNYIILFGAQAYTDTVGGGFSAQVAFQVNSDAVPADARITTPTGDYINIMGFAPYRVKNGGNSTITMLYRSSGGPAATAHFQNRILLALRYANL